MKTSRLFLVATLALAVLGCQKKEEAAPEMAQDRSERSMAEPAPAAPSAMPSLSAESAPQRQFVRSAELRFRCRSVVQATASIERIVAANGGYVESNDLRSSVAETRERPYGMDSVLEIQRVEIWNAMTLRVPNDRLDTVLAAIEPLVAFLDQRTIRAQDVGRELRRAERERLRMERAGERLRALEQNPAKVRDLAHVEEQAQQREDRAVGAMDRSDELKEQVALSSVQVSLYQHRESRVDTLQRPLEEVWKEPFSSRFVRAFLEGWSGFLGLVLWLLSNWLVLAILAGIVALVVRLRRAERDAS